MGFTPEELAEMAKADAEIEASFCILMDEISLSRELDREALLDRMEFKTKRRVKHQRQYYQTNKDKIAEYQRQYYQTNKDKIAEHKRQYNQANKDKIAEHQRQYNQANKDKIAEYQRQYRASKRG